MHMKSLRAYVDLMKLRVVELLIITTLPAMVLAEKGLPSFGLVAATLILSEAHSLQVHRMLSIW